MISFILPCYWANEELIEMTIDCLDSIIVTTDDEPEEILVVDDGSPIPFSLEDDTDFVQHVLNLRRTTNGGYSAAANMGLFHATGDILIVGNNDLIFEKNWLTGLLRVLEEGFDVATCWTSDQKFIKEPVIKEAERFGSLFAMKREVYETIGGFDEQFRGYFADDDYRQRIKKAGFTIGMNYNLVVKHLAKATYNVTDPDDTEFQRAKILYEIKHGLE